MHRGQLPRPPSRPNQGVADSTRFLLVFVLAQLSLQVVFGLSFGIRFAHADWRSQS